MNDKQKIVTIILALICNFTFLLTAQTRQAPIDGAKKLPECIRSHGADSLETRRNMAYFQVNWKKKEYVNAYANWRYVFNNAPCAYKSIYQLGPQLLHFMINNSRNDATRLRLLDTLFMVFPARIKYFGEEAYVKGSWAYYMSKHSPDKGNEIMSLYAYYFNYQNNRIDERYVVDYMRKAITSYKKGDFGQEQLCTLYHRLRDTAESYNVKTAEDTVISAYWIQAISDLDKMMTADLKCTLNEYIYLLKPMKASFFKSFIKVNTNFGIIKTNTQVHKNNS